MPKRASIVKKSKLSKMENYRQSYLFSERDSRIAYCKGNGHHAVWENDSITKKENTISVSKLLDLYLFSCDIDFTSLSVRKSKNITSLVTTEILERLQQKNVDDVGLDGLFERKCEEKHGLGPNCDADDVAEVREMALNCFRSFRSFYDPNAESLRSLQTHFAQNFIESEYSIWADIKLDENLKCLCGTIDAIYWINKDKKHVGIITWNISKRGKPIMHEGLPLQRRKCQLHLYASILVTKYG